MLDPINKDNGKWYKSESGLFLPKTHHSDSYIVETKQTFLKKEMSWVIDNLTLVLLFPSLFGAVWQILELSGIHISYIRFFSLSQIPVDGALILLLLFVFYAVGRLIKSFVSYTSKAKMERYMQPDMLEKIMENLDHNIKKDVTTLVTLVFIVTALAVFFIINIFSSGPLFTIFLFGFFTLGICLIVSDIIILYCIKLYNSDASATNIDSTIRTGLKNYKNYIAWFAIASIVVVILLILLLLKSVSDNFILPMNLYNTENMEDVIYSDFKTTAYDIEYMNDQYIFVSLCTIESCSNETDKKIVIYPTETVLFE